MGLSRPLLDRLRARAAELGLTEAVEFAPPMPHDQLFSLMQAADAVVIPSLREPFGIAAAEAMLLGVPVVLTRVDGFVELVGDSEGALMVCSQRPQRSRGGDLVAEDRPRFAPAGGGARTSADCGEFRNVRLRLEMGAAVRSRHLAVLTPKLALTSAKAIAWTARRDAAQGRRNETQFSRYGVAYAILW